MNPFQRTRVGLLSLSQRSRPPLKQAITDLSRGLDVHVFRLTRLDRAGARTQTTLGSLSFTFIHLHSFTGDWHRTEVLPNSNSDDSSSSVSSPIKQPITLGRTAVIHLGADFLCLSFPSVKQQHHCCGLPNLWLCLSSRQFKWRLNNKEQPSYRISVLNPHPDLQCPLATLKKQLGNRREDQGHKKKKKYYRKDIFFFICIHFEF